MPSCIQWHHHFSGGKGGESVYWLDMLIKVLFLCFVFFNSDIPSLSCAIESLGNAIAFLHLFLHLAAPRSWE
jgi:hypothetical protein